MFTHKNTLKNEWQPFFIQHTVLSRLTVKYEDIPSRTF